MLKIFKYSVDYSDTFDLDLPKHWVFLHVDTQGDEPFMWLLVDPEDEVERHTFYVRSTGQPFTGQEGDYLGTFLLANGTLVFHLFDSNVL